MQFHQIKRYFSANVVLNGSAASRSVTVTAGAQAGSSAITIWAIDTGAKSNSNDIFGHSSSSEHCPVISMLPRTNCLMDFGTPPIPFTIGDPETPAADLTVSGVSANPTLLPNANIVFGGSDSNRTVTLTPTAGQIGVAPITLTVSERHKHSEFFLRTNGYAVTSLIFLDSFSYAMVRCSQIPVSFGLIAPEM